MQIGLEDLKRLAMEQPSIKRGCVVDTNVLFAAAFPLDIHNEWSEEVFDALRELQIPCFTNINVRSEFIELNRRVLIPESLVDYYEDHRNILDIETQAKLKSLKTRKERAASEERTFKLSDSEIKEFRLLLSRRHPTTGATGWDLLCESYFAPYITPVWNNIVQALNIQFLGTREIESNDYFNARPGWNDMLDIVGKFGIGVSDAMIVNLFIKSNLPLIVTTDQDVSNTASALLKSDPERYVLVSNPR